MKTFAAPAKRNGLRTTPAPNANAAGQTWRAHSPEVRHTLSAPALQPKLTIGEPNDTYEQEADRVADEVMRMPQAAGTPSYSPVSEVHSGLLQRACPECETDDDLQRKPSGGKDAQVAPGLSAEIRSLTGRGFPLPSSARAFFEPRFGMDFRDVRVHTGSQAAELARAVNARAFTIGEDVVFARGEYRPESATGKALLAHELAHTIQQRITPRVSDFVQRADLTSPRLAGNTLFESVLDNNAVIEVGASGPEVRRIQQLLIDLGYNLSQFGADGDFGSGTRTAVRAFQVDRGLADDGRVGTLTIEALDLAFPAFALPLNRTAPWTMACVLDILCPWNRHLVENVLPSFSIVTFDSRSFPIERWNAGSGHWVSDTFHSGGFRGGTNMGFLNTTTCEQFALTVYHEGWHGQQPASPSGVVEVERDAYINTEQWSISLGVPGQTFTDTTTGTTADLRDTSISGETVVDEAAAERLVQQGYGGVSSVPGERILWRTGSLTDPNVRVRRSDGSEYERSAVDGESFRAGPPVMTNLTSISSASWSCP